MAREVGSYPNLAGGDMMGRMCGFGACDVRGRCAVPGSSVGRAGEYGPESGGSRTAGGRGGRVGESGGNVCGILQPRQAPSDGWVGMRASQTPYDRHARGEGEGETLSSNTK